MLFSQYKSKNVDNYVEEQHILQVQLESLWLIVNRKNSKFILNEKTQNTSFYKS